MGLLLKQSTRKARVSEPWEIEKPARSGLWGTTLFYRIDGNVRPNFSDDFSKDIMCGPRQMRVFPDIRAEVHSEDSIKISSKMLADSVRITSVKKSAVCHLGDETAWTESICSPSNSFNVRVVQPACS